MSGDSRDTDQTNGYSKAKQMFNLWGGKERRMMETNQNQIVKNTK